MGRVTVRRPVLRVTESGSRTRPDTLAAEEPLEIRVNGRALSVTMRTPGHDVELAHGFLLTERVIADKDDLHSARYCDSPGPDGRNTYNVLDILLAPGVTPPDTSVERNFYTTSSCGVCGKAALDSVRLSTRHSPEHDPLEITPETLAALPDRLRAAQKVFDSTGGLHGAALFDGDGNLLVCREDVGRHNAVDKVLGWAVLERRVPLRGCVLMVSGRASFELVQKAAMAGVPLLSAVSAPSSLAVELAAEQGMTLVGFLRGSSMNVYTGTHRILEPDAAPVP
ncbi:MULTISPECIES: formate dehydrogenase accessory sulfurtransferase FdhD [Saccharopolyspora]|uniref:Sulfur carrier protein FdhD n=1 Tax=Saccharopolyspora gregorii TaxID=33914 RepID=A0ABP6RWQ7_9PSEU|nr:MULTISPECIES: formate dehydrogenase accessory sulfurtransferase FdhD [Saccharopolyspora]MCA1188235.1 formate dehydrogenase accessory sulfurtransferase FdhD [Saccharopolyspora sp. 6T]MCA1192697.1 formate dehydrogenase accessory sulfurtransferase FdhD [Saccharopolyspora sp. 6V]MCA1227932.1 formate dehydrogenase accessory sulfurtransferase FdhD [Saccharopolyspora sp. 6M]MCA1280471.1 formate dehydrogenase accessory sulfurtransferase FdhD [Saccharopolyspora sp. 7B]